MQPSITLYDYTSDAIHINIVAGFKDGDLVVDGYDHGKTVEAAWGDSDYEYVLTIKKENTGLIYNAMSVPQNQQQELLDALAQQFHGNKCFSELEKFLTAHAIPHERFTWT